MRKIKFRAWNEVEEKMYSWYDFLDTNMKNTFIAPESTAMILMQYTGLKDKNGKEIYEGDIIRFYNKYNDDESISKVYTFKGTLFCIDVETGEYDVQTLAWAMDDVIEDIEVIGNIYENPELLEDKE